MSGGAYRVSAAGGSIDVHHHHFPPGLAALSGPDSPARVAAIQGRAFAHWTPERSIEQMDKFGIATAVLSMTQRAELLYEGAEKGRGAVRLCNDYAAKMMADYPGRFGLFASIPMPDIEGSLAEIEYAYSTLKCDGISLYTNDNHGRYPGDPYYEPLWRELDRRKAIVYMHPWVPACCRNLGYGANMFMNEVDFETPRAVTSLLTSGTLSRHPGVRLVTVHSGGTLPMLAGRMQNRWPDEGVKYVPNGVATELAKLYYDIAHGAFPANMAALLKLVPETQVLLGSDYPFEPMETTLNEIPGLGFTEKLLRSIERGNAEVLLPRLKAKA
jgi:predicted TIM-barrel fold metal-dependent hydrolase